ncbi:hypothetical protein [Mesorhizobium amorphae]|uniref:hypothetical protein n=1 Tax=Mesorhizobium amorphae TaxID=71433 RepID=UPI001181D949|nr:hypothetical protein [Mesorhizobium amorphae]
MQKIEKARKTTALMADNAVRDDGVAGSNPATPTRKISDLAFPKNSRFSAFTIIQSQTVNSHRIRGAGADHVALPAVTT